MVSKQKIILSVVMIVLTALFVGFSLFSVFAASEQNVSTDVTVQYTAPSIDAKMCATYSIDGATPNYFTAVAKEGTDASVSGNYLVFKSDATRGNVGSLKVSGEFNFNSSVEIKYTFINTSSAIDFKASLTVSVGDNINTSLTYTVGDGVYGVVVPSNVEVAAGQTVDIYVKAVPTVSVCGATYCPKFSWTIVE